MTITAADFPPILETVQRLHCLLQDDEANPADIGTTTARLIDLIVYGPDTVNRLLSGELSRKRVRFRNVYSPNGVVHVAAEASEKVCQLLAYLAQMNPMTIQRGEGTEDAKRRLYALLVALAGAPPVANRRFEKSERDPERDAEIRRLYFEQGMTQAKIFEVLKKHPRWRIMEGNKPVTKRAVEGVVNRAKHPRKPQ